MAVHNNGGRPWRWFGGAVVWVFKHIGYDRLARLYHVCRIRDRAWMDGFLRFLLNNEKPENPLGRSFVQHFFKDELQQTVARWIGPTDVDVLRQLEEIPSETTIRERHFLVHPGSSCLTRDHLRSADLGAGCLPGQPDDPAGPSCPVLEPPKSFQNHATTKVTQTTKKTGIRAGILISPTFSVS